MNGDMQIIPAGKDTQKISGSIAVDTTGLATEAKQDDIITAIGAIPAGGVQYTEGDTDATITGTAVMWEDTGNALVAASANKPLPVDITQDVNVAFGPGTLDEFGHLVVGSVNNQIDIQFYRDTVANLTTATTGSGGTASATGGMATFAATTTANSFAKGVSPTTTVYTAGAELYAIFTAGWTGTGSGTSFQRIGLYDDNNGFFLGFEGNTFKATVRKGGSDDGVAKASFSEDTLTGAADSKFTRNGVPEAVILTNLNVYRIRFGWVGSAPINFEILSPDGNWVTFHRILQPNNSNLPHIENADLPVTCHVSSGNSGAALTLITNCWAAGTTQALSKINSTITSSTLAGLQRSVITGETTAGGGGFVNVKVDPSGAVNVAGTVTVGALPNEGQQTMANSISVAIASNQTAVPVSATDLDIRNLAKAQDEVYSVLRTDAGAAYDARQVTLQSNNGVDVGDVTINNGAGVAAVNIQDGGNTITVDGSVTATLSAETTKVIGTINVAAGQSIAVTQGTATNLKAQAEMYQGGTAVGAAAPLQVSLANHAANATAVKVDGSAVTQPVSLATNTPTIATGSNAIGKLIPPDIDVTTHTNYARKYYTNAGAVTDGIVWSPAAGKRWHVVSLFINVSAACTVTLEDDKAAGDDPVWKAELAANSGAFINFPEKYPMASGEDAADLLITTTAGNVYVTVVGYEI